MAATQLDSLGQLGKDKSFAPPQLAKDSNWISWAVFFASFALYLATFGVRDDGQLLGNDALPYAHQLATGQSLGLFNAAHLLFHPLALGLAKLLAWLPNFEFNELTVLFAQQCLSALGGAFAAVMVLRFAMRCTRTSVGLWIAAIYTCCYANWVYSAVGETYTPATAMVAILLVQSAEIRLGWRRENVVALCAWLLLAVCLRQDSVLVICALPFLLRPRTSITVIGASGALAILVYATAWALADLDQPFESWLRNLSESGLWGHTPTLESLAFAIGLSAASIHSGIIHLYQAINGQLPFASLNIWAAVLSISILVLYVGFPRQRTQSTKVVLASLAFYVVVRLGFFTWWQPTNLEYYNGTLLPLALFASLMLRTNRGRLPVWPLILACVLIAAGNLTAFVLPNRTTSVSEATNMAVDAIGPGGMIVALNANQYHALLREPPRNVEVIDGADLFVRNNLDRLPGIVDAIGHQIESGKPVLLLRELGLWSRMGFPERPINMTAIDQLIPLYHSRPLLNEEGEPLGLFLEP